MCFRGMPSLETLYLGLNELSSLPPRVFSNLTKLEFLDLQVLKATELSPGIFETLMSLEKLWLTYSRLRVMPRLSGLSNLTVLPLFGNRELREFPPGAFSGLPSLRILDLAYNWKMRLRADLFTGLSGLWWLHLGHGNLSEIPPGMFSGLAGLGVLYLDENKLSELSAGTFSDLAGLTHLRLGGNSFATLPGGAFEDLGNLEYLRLEENQLAELPPGMFRRLTSLRSLYLHDNPGAPFGFDLAAVRTDNTDLLAPGPARVEIRLQEGTPFTMRVPVSVHNGTISTNSVALKSASERSAEFTVTRPGRQPGRDASGDRAVSIDTERRNRDRSPLAGSADSLCDNSQSCTDPGT